MIEYTVRVDEVKTEWYLDGKRHRVDGPAVEWASGDKAWYLNGKYHRVDGPAVERADGYKAWYLNGHPHREDGPAAERADGSTRWCLRNVPMTKEQFQAVVKNKRLTSEEIESLKSYGIEI